MSRYIQSIASLALCLFLAWPAPAAEEQPAPSVKPPSAVLLEQSTGTRDRQATESKEPGPSEVSSDEADTPPKEGLNPKAVGQGIPKAEEVPQAESSRSSSPQDPTDSTGTPEVAPRSGTAKPSETTGEKKDRATPGRRWIIKQRPPASNKKATKKPKPIAWENDDQRIRCEAHQKELRKNFLNARYYSVQGDSCSTAAHAKAFLESCQNSQKACPAGILEAYGYREEQLRNLELLYELGTKRCKDKRMTDPMKK